MSDEKKTDAIARRRTEPTLVTIGNRLLSPDGRWHPNLVADYLLQHGGRERWIKIGDLARVFFNTNSPSNRERVRRRLYHVMHRLLDRDILMVVDRPQGGGAQACKLYDPRSGEERQFMHEWLIRMQKSKQLKAETVQKAVMLVECLDATVDTNAV